MGTSAQDSANANLDTGENDQTAETGQDGQDEDSQEIDVVLSTDDGSPPKPQHHGIRKRINKLNARNEASEGRASDAEAEVELLKSQNKLLRLAVDQTPDVADLPPDPNDFDDGAKDPGYAKALRDFNSGFFEEQYQKRAEVQNAAPQVDANLERKQAEHYEAAGKLGVKDYEAVEDVALGILGRDTVNRLIGATDTSPRVLYYLGKNPDAAHEIAELVKTDPISAVLRLGALGATLKVQPRQKSNVAPDPDDELEGAVNKGSGRRGPRGATFE